MASISKRTTKNGTTRWWVRWREQLVIADADGNPVQHEKSRSKTFSTQRAALKFKREVETMTERGENWQPPRKKVVGTVRNAALAWVAATVKAGAPEGTSRHRGSMMGAFLAFLDADKEDGSGANTPISVLSLELLENYADRLPSAGRKASTRHRKVLAVEQMWRWAYDRRSRFPGCPPPERLTGSAREADRISAPPPVVAVAAPNWADVDAMIGQLKVEWHRRAALIMRFHGARASQVCGLKWSDVDLDNGLIYWRSHVRGAKAGRSRVVPLHPWLQQQMAGWGVREGLLFPRRYRDPETGEQRPGPYRGDALVAPFRRAWTLAKVPRDRWDIPKQGGRAKGSPTHAIRRCLRTELIRAGVEEAVVLYFVGQSQGLTAAAYVPEQSPEQSPYWPRLVEGLEHIPAPGSVLRLAGRG